MPTPNLDRNLEEQRELAARLRAAAGYVENNIETLLERSPRGILNLENLEQAARIWADDSWTEYLDG